MKAIIKNWTLAEVSAVILIVALMTCTSNNQAWTQRPSGRDSLPKEKVFVIRLTERQLASKLDTLNGVVRFVGRKLDADAADKIQEAYSIAINGLLNNAKIDSSGSSRPK